uniref:Uncharacterized protein n=1 Tax=Minutocellus polymorphus TaxID=265543 RepID=A0A6U0KFS0_9STRA|mmetsp:Transcript_3747/g.6503  ORF Transcript_3747/g.6503 Transcript_3747/m.6503 type:complete len:170 (+) Transcript_3747:64-573(+)|eukprot:CAMPEP_0181044224 /NCGR_PEP_ID=MMETSP1070-20121207/13143_1 /TAXON_ID=265543 /ORGANISM="Minutocellus polymorphus, Strain NH13" /LENGTH=169 /DNA_ID=CAMNT_0023122637 /DNA_START=51 /DNA_END=560 /DNA_ORIENTATION=+
MMSPNARAALLVFAVVLSVSSAFSPTSPAPRRANSRTYVPSTLARSVPGPRIFPLHMSAEDEAERLRAQAAKLREEVAEATGKSVAEIKAETAAPPAAEEKQVQLNSDGTLYDDETPEYRDPLSDSMRSRLMKEASSGLDSESKQTNVILYISIAVVVLVLLGGQGILY